VVVEHLGYGWMLHVAVGDRAPRVITIRIDANCGKPFAPIGTNDRCDTRLQLQSLVECSEIFRLSPCRGDIPYS